jgi:hypothetical protein
MIDEWCLIDMKVIAERMDVVAGGENEVEYMRLERRRLMISEWKDEVWLIDKDIDRWIDCVVGDRDRNVCLIMKRWRHYLGSRRPIYIQAMAEDWFNIFYPSDWRGAMRSDEEWKEIKRRRHKIHSQSASRPAGPSVDILEQKTGTPVLCLFQEAVKEDRQTLSQAVCFEKAPRREEWGVIGDMLSRMQGKRSDSRDRWFLLLRSHEAASSIHAGRSFPCESLVSMRPSSASF